MPPKVVRRPGSRSRSSRSLSTSARSAAGSRTGTGPSARTSTSRPSSTRANGGVPYTSVGSTDSASPACVRSSTRRGATSRTRRGRRRLRTSTSIRRARSGSTVPASVPRSRGANVRTFGTCCRNGPVSSSSPRRCSERLSDAPSSAISATPPLRISRIAGEASIVSTMSSPRSSTRARGSSSSSEMATGRPSKSTRPQPASRRSSASSFVTGSAAREPGPRSWSTRRSTSSGLTVWASAGRDSSAESVEASGVSFPSVTMARVTRRPPSARESR